MDRKRSVAQKSKTMKMKDARKRKEVMAMITNSYFAPEASFGFDREYTGDYSEFAEDKEKEYSF